MPGKRTIRIQRTVTVKSTVRWQRRVTITPQYNPGPSSSVPAIAAPSVPAITSRTVRRTPLSSIPSLVHEPVPDRETGEAYDVFVAHAWEDKVEFARPLAHALRSHGLKVWFDEFELRAGDSLRRKIDRGLASSRTGLVVLSQTFLTKGWSNTGWAGYELDGIVAKSNTGEQQLLPIWYGITRDDLMRCSPTLTDRVALNADELSLDEIAVEIADLIRSRS